MRVCLHFQSSYPEDISIGFLQTLVNICHATWHHIIRITAVLNAWDISCGQVGMMGRTVSIRTLQNPFKAILKEKTFPFCREWSALNSVAADMLMSAGNFNSIKWNLECKLCVKRWLDWCWRGEPKLPQSVRDVWWVIFTVLCSVNQALRPFHVLIEETSIF